MGVNMTLPAAFEDTLSTQEQIQWLYKYKEALLTAGANIQITRQGDTVVISAIGEGFSPTVEVTEIPGGHEVTITDGTGAHTFDVMDGVDGDDGVSPAVVVTSITGGHRVVITDEDHPSGQSFDVMDGVDGTDGTSITVKSVTPVSGGVNLVITDSAGDHTIFLANGPQGLTGPQGPQGPTGATGATGETGATPIITMTASADDTSSASPTVTVTKTGTDLNPAFSLAFSGLKGATGAQGPQGETGEQGPAGEDGADGTDGVTPVITATATADATSSDNPTVTVTKSGTDAAPSFAFAFSGLKGATGATGAQGPQGPAGQDGADGQDGTDGTDGVTPVITATATADATHSANPSVTVTKSGTDAAPSFAFAFSGLQGEQGAQGETGATGAQGPQGETGATGATGPQGPAGQGVPTGGTAGQVLAKVDGTDYNTEWVTPSGGSEVTCGVIPATSISTISFKDASGTAITIDSGKVNKPSILVTKKNDGTNDRFEIEVAQGVYCGAATSDSGMTVKTLEFVFGDGTNALTVSIDGETVTLPGESYGSLLHLVNGKSNGFKCKQEPMSGTTSYHTGIYSVWYEGKQIHLKYTFDEAVTVARLDSLDFKADKELIISAGGGGVAGPVEEGQVTNATVIWIKKGSSNASTGSYTGGGLFMKPVTVTASNGTTNESKYRIAIPKFQCYFSCTNDTTWAAGDVFTVVIRSTNAAAFIGKFSTGNVTLSNNNVLSLQSWTTAVMNVYPNSFSDVSTAPGFTNISYNANAGTNYVQYDFFCHTAFTAKAGKTYALVLSNGNF